MKKIKNKIDFRKELKIRYTISENGCIQFVDPCCDSLPVSVFMKIVSSLNEIQKDYNNSITNKKLGELV